MTTSEKLTTAILAFNDARVWADRLDALEECSETHIAGNVVDVRIVVWRYSLNEALALLGRLVAAYGVRYTVGQVWNGYENNMVAEYVITGTPVRVWLGMPASEFPIDVLSPGCRIEKSECRTVTHRVVCPVKQGITC
jgi:hypothetical protein